MSATKQLYYKQNRLKQLRAFCAAARAGSVSQAAETLFLSQPTVSLQIQALERDMNVVLFERRGPRITLTPEGVVLHQIAEPLVDGIEGLEESFNAHFGSLETGELNIAAGESTTLYILPRYIKRFATAYPGVKIKLHNVTGRDGMAMLRADEADLAVGSMLDVPDDILYHLSLAYSATLITPRPSPGKEEGSPGRHLPPRPDPASPASGDLALSGTGVQPVGPEFQGLPGSRRLGDHQEVRGTGYGYLHCHRCLSHRGGTAGGNLHGWLHTQAFLWRRGKARQVSQPPGTGVHRHDGS